MGLRKCYLDPMVQVMINHFSDLHGKLMLELGDQVISDEDVSEKTGKEYFGNLGIHHASFDLNGLHGAIPVDLSRPVNNPEWKNHFDIVTNAGTIEHVEPKIGQYECFRNVHNWMKTGGISIHLAPDIDELEKYGRWRNHCNNYYSRKFFEMLADHNEYEIISLEMINGLVFACLKKQSDVPFMSDRQTLLAHIVRKSGGIVYQGINESALQRIYRFPKRFVKRCLRWVT